MDFIGLVGLALAALAAAPTTKAPPPKSFAWHVNDNVPPPNASMASRKGFGVQMLVTDDYEGFWKAWEGPTPPRVSITSRTERGKPVMAMLIFTGCKAGADGNCNVSADYTITAPNGAPYGEPKSGPVWRLPPAPGYNLQLSEGAIGLEVESGEMLGAYTLKATVTDHIASLTLTVEAKVDVVEAMPSLKR